MEYIIRGEKIAITKAIKEYVNEKFTKFEKYFEDPENVSVRVLCSVRGQEQKIEVTINSKVYDLRAEETNKDLYAAIDLVSDVLERQIRKYKTKLMTREKAEMVYDYIDDDEPIEEEVVRRKKVYLKPMDEEEAITQMELLGHTFFIFKDIVDNDIKVVYKRYDNTFGIIETN